jgi:hypothetical protein
MDSNTLSSVLTQSTEFECQSFIQIHLNGFKYIILDDYPKNKKPTKKIHHFNESFKIQIAPMSES